MANDYYLTTVKLGSKAMCKKLLDNVSPTVTVYGVFESRYKHDHIKQHGDQNLIR